MSKEEISINPMEISGNLVEDDEINVEELKARLNEAQAEMVKAVASNNESRKLKLEMDINMLIAKMKLLKSNKAMEQPEKWMVDEAKDLNTRANIN